MWDLETIKRINKRPPRQPRPLRMTKASSYTPAAPSAPPCPPHKLDQLRLIDLALLVNRDTRLTYHEQQVQIEQLLRQMKEIL